MVKRRRRFGDAATRSIVYGEVCGVPMRMREPLADEDVANKLNVARSPRTGNLQSRNEYKRGGGGLAGNMA